MTSSLELAVDYAKSQRFLPDARVAGVLVNADIGPVSYGDLYGADRAAGDEFIRFEAVGVDNRNGYDIVRTSAGIAYVVVSYAAHAKSRGLRFLTEHIAANQDWYAVRLAATWQ